MNVVEVGQIWVFARGKRDLTVCILGHHIGMWNVLVLVIHDNAETDVPRLARFAMKDARWVRIA